MKDPRLDKFRTFLERVENSTGLLMAYAILALPTVVVLFLLFYVLRIVYRVVVLLLQSV